MNHVDSVLLCSLNGRIVRPDPNVAMPGNRLTEKAVTKTDALELGTRGIPSQTAVHHLLIDGIRDQFEDMLPEIGEIARNEPAKGLDWSPEAVSNRIVDFAMSHLGAYREAHPDGSEGERMNGFSDRIRGAVEKGFSNARSIFQAMRVLEGQVGKTIQLTYDLTMEGLDDALNWEPAAYRSSQ